MSKEIPPRLHNKASLAGRRRKLRRRLTPAEATLWKLIKNSQLEGRKFRRQHSIGPYIVDFYCVEESLAVELDGQVHRSERNEDKDGKRTTYLKSTGVKVIRFENYMVFEDTEFVLGTIKGFFEWKSRQFGSSQ